MNKLQQFCMCHKLLNSYLKKRDGSICDLSLFMIRGVLSLTIPCRASKDHQLCTMALVDRQIHRSCCHTQVDNNNTDVGHLTREYSHLLWHFLTHRGEIECKVTRRLSPHSRLEDFLLRNTMRSW